MDGVHDLGGRLGFGPVAVEPDEPVFHFEWERRALGVTMVSFVLGVSNGGEFRHSIERMDAVHYLTSRYYEHWATSTATRLVETGRVTADELAQRAGGPFPLSRPVGAVRVDEVDGDGDGGGATAARYAMGHEVRVRQWHPIGHTRCPQYVRGKRGVVTRVDPPSSLPDIEAHSDARRIEHVYSVRFDAAALWGEPGDGAACVHVDLWESYLEPETRQ